MLSDNPTEEEIMAEIEKCHRDPYYFFITYHQDEFGNKPTITREQWNERMVYFKLNQYITHETP